MISPPLQSDKMRESVENTFERKEAGNKIVFHLLLICDSPHELKP